MARATLRSLAGLYGFGVMGAAALAAAGCSPETGDLFGSEATGTGGAGASSSATGHGGDTATATGTGGGQGGQGGSGAQGGAGGAPPGCGDDVKSDTEECDGADLGGKTCGDFGFSNPNGLACGNNCKLVTAGCTTTCDGAKLEMGEACDGADLGGHSCVEQGYAEPDGVVCNNCQLDFSGCAANCGNGTVEPGETCEDNDLDGKSCTDFGFVDPNGLGCAGDCLSYDTSNCQAACNGTLEDGEECDGNDLDGKTCADLGFVNPAGLQCTNCVFDTSGCTAVCGNNTVEPGEECDDNNMNPGDGCSANCKFENTTCATATPVALALGVQIITGNTAAGGSHTATGCAGTAGPDRIFAVTPAVGGFITASLKRSATTFNSALYVSAACTDNGPNADLLCADSYDAANNMPLNGGEVLSFLATANTTYYLFVDGVLAGDSGDFQLTLDLSAGGTCNDPILIPLEAGSPMKFLGSNVNMTASGGGSCGGNSNARTDVVYQITRSTSGPLAASIPVGSANFNTTLYFRSSCGNNEISCSNNAGNNGGESLNVPNGVNGGTPVFLWVDGSTLNNGIPSGEYTLTVTP